MPAEAVSSANSPATPPIHLQVLLGRPGWSRWSQFPPEEAAWSPDPPSPEVLVLAPGAKALPSRVSLRTRSHPVVSPVKLVGTSISGCCSSVQDVWESLPAGGGHAATQLQMVPASFQLPVGHQDAVSVRRGAEGGATTVLQTYAYLDHSPMSSRTFIFLRSATFSHLCLYCGLPAGQKGCCCWNPVGRGVAAVTLQQSHLRTAGV